MKPFQLLRTSVALSFLTLAGSAQLSANLMPDPGLQVAQGKWYSADGDSREVLAGHVTDESGKVLMSMLAVLRPDDKPVQAGKYESGLMYGQLKIEEQGDLSSELDEIFQTDPGIERRIEIIGRWERREDGVGQFDALVAWGGHVIIGTLRGVYGPDLGETVWTPPLAVENPFSVAIPFSSGNPFGVAVVGSPLTTIFLPADPFGLRAKESGILPGDEPFSTPPRAVETGDFAAQLMLYTL